MVPQQRDLTFVSSKAAQVLHVNVLTRYNAQTVIFLFLLKPKMLVTASFGIEPGRRVEYIPLVKKALEMSSHKPSKVLIYNRPNMVRNTKEHRPTIIKKSKLNMI